MNCESAQRAVDRAARPAVRPVDMPDVVMPSPANNRRLGETYSRCHVCQATCRHHSSINDPSSSSSSSSSSAAAAAAAAARCQVVYVNRDNDDYSHQQPLPDLVNVHRQHAPAPYDDRPPTSTTCHARATAVNHYVPQPAPSAAVHSPAHYCVRRVRAWSKLDCCERSLTGCVLSTTALKWSMLILVSLGFACVIIGLILAVLQIAAGNVQHQYYSLVHSVILMGLGAALVAVVAVIWKCVLSSSDGRSGSRPCCRLLTQLSDRLTGHRSSTLRSSGRVQCASGRPACTASYRHCDYHWPAGADSPEIQRQLPPSYSASLHSCESTHGTCQLAGQHCADSASPPLACARRLCVATLPGRSACRLYVAGESVQCRMVPCTEMCRHNCYGGSWQT